MPKYETDLAKQLWAIGDSVRLQILQLLPDSANCVHGNNVSDIGEKLGLSQPTISYHLRVLRQAGLVAGKRMCRDVYYWVDHEEAERVREKLRVIFHTTAVPKTARKRRQAPAPP